MLSVVCLPIFTVAIGKSVAYTVFLLNDATIQRTTSLHTLVLWHENYLLSLNPHLVRKSF